MGSIDNLVRVARALAPLREYKFVYAGASILPRLIDDPGARPLRPTVDVDAVVNVVTYAQFDRLRTRLATCGLRVLNNSDPGKGRFCLFHLGDDPPIEVDIMAVKYREAGCPSRMLEVAFEFAESWRLEDDLVVHTISACGSLAAKFEAFFERGLRDIHVSKDLDDIVTLLDGRLAMEAEIETADPETRYFIASHAAKCLANPEIREMISDYLRGTGRAQRLFGLLERVSVVGIRRATG